MVLVLFKSLGAKMVSKTASGGKRSAVKLVGKEAGPRVSYEEEWQQREIMVLPSLLSSLVPTSFDAYSCCESARELWSTLSQVYGNLSSLSRVFDMSHEGGEFSIHLGELSTLWSDLKDLRPQSIDPEELHEGGEQDRVVDLSWILKPAYNNLLRSEKLSALEEVGDQPRKEECPKGLFKTKEMWSCASQAEGSTQGSKAVYKEEDRGSIKYDHYKKGEHMKRSCWVLNSRLKPAKSK